MTKVPHISVCVCTYKRPDLLARLLNCLATQETQDLFNYSAVIVDNDQSRSAQPVVSRFAAESDIPVTYIVEPQQNIALARNRAVANAQGDFIAFIDDDEFPIAVWLLTLFQICTDRGVDGVLGPVMPHFDEEPPRWVINGKFHERATYPTGLVIDWRKGRTGNVLLRRLVFEGSIQPFKPEFRTGEDQEFFHRAIDKGFVFIWCNEAVAYEVVPPIRWRRSFMLRRALLRGAMEPQTPDFGPRDVAKSAIAVAVYTAALPFAFVAGQDKFMHLLVRICDHLGKLSVVIGFNPVKEQYITE
ncbi:MAG TPA: glycosyltransferase [Bryobacteraceae bacterium]|nr:glycosyltransferase [Bryobacteraceae bacterium]